MSTHDVVLSTNKSAAVMSETLCKYGEGSMGDGLFDFGQNMYFQGRKDTIKSICEHCVVGVCVAIVGIGVIGLTARGVKTINKQRIKKRINNKNNKGGKESCRSIK